MTDYSETQQFRQLWVWLVLSVCGVGVAVALVATRGDQSGGAFLLAVAITAFVFGALLVVIWMLKMTTTVSDTSLKVKFTPVPSGRVFDARDISSAEPATYSALKEFGGWGVRWGWGGSRAYNVYGNRGVKITDNAGKVWMIGTQRPEELADAVNSLI